MTGVLAFQRKESRLLAARHRFCGRREYANLQGLGSTESGQIRDQDLTPAATPKTIRVRFSVSRLKPELHTLLGTSVWSSGMEFSL